MELCGLGFEYVKEMKRMDLHQEERIEKKRKEDQLYVVLEGNPTRVERLTALYDGKVLRETYVVPGKGSVDFYYKLDGKGRLMFSGSDLPEDFYPVKESFNYGPVMRDVMDDGTYKVFTILDRVDFAEDVKVLT